MKKERSIEEYLKAEVEKLGGLCLKWVSPGNRGAPDRIIVIRGMTLFVELKGPKGVLSPLQEGWQKKLRARGQISIVISSKEEVQSFVTALGHAISVVGEKMEWMEVSGLQR